MSKKSNFFLLKIVTEKLRSKKQACVVQTYANRLLYSRMVLFTTFSNTPNRVSRKSYSGRFVHSSVIEVLEIIVKSAIRDY